VLKLKKNNSGAKGLSFRLIFESCMLTSHVVLSVGLIVLACRLLGYEIEDITVLRNLCNYVPVDRS